MIDVSKPGARPIAPLALSAGGVLLLTLSCGEASLPAGADGGASGQTHAEAGGPPATAARGGAGGKGLSSAGATSTTGSAGAVQSAGGQSVGGASGVSGSHANAGGASGVGGGHANAGVDAGGGSDGGAAGEGDTGGWGGNCLVGVPKDEEPASPLHTGKVGDACVDWGSTACSGANQKQMLVCTLGTWAVLQDCAANENCDQQTGRCASILPACAAREPGALYCDGDALQECGADRVTASASTCCGACSNGECRAPRCGDGRTTAAEGCDDGNRVSGDGCDSDCQPSSVVQLVAGLDHTCALLREGRVRCWGGNSQGQLGRGDATAHTAQHPYELGLVALGGQATQLVAGSRHTCALLSDGSVQCWGANEHGQLGLGHTHVIGDDEVPDAQHAAVSLGVKATRLTAGGESSCAQLQDSTLRCWGRNDFGQLGTGRTVDVGDDELPTAANAGVALAGQAALAAGESGEHLCVALQNKFLCWGDNRYQQLDFMRAWDLGNASPVLEVLGSGWRTYTMLDDNPKGLFAAGFNLDGLLGSGGPSPTNFPSDAAYLRGHYGTVEAAASPTHLCYTEVNQTLRCVGLNDKGQLGFADVSDRYFPEAVSLGLDTQANQVWVLNIAAGGSHTCAWLNTGKLRCWGLNDAAQLGLGYSSSAPLDHVGGSASDNAETAIAVRLFK